MEPTVRVLEARLIFKEPEAVNDDRKSNSRNHDEARQRAGVTRGAGYGK